MDLNPAALTHVTGKDTISPSCTKSDENGQSRGSGGFKTVMNDVMASDDQDTRVDDTQSSSSNEQPDKEQEAIPVALPVALPEPPVDPQIQLVNGELASTDAAALPAENSPHLAWFRAEGFEPPNAATLSTHTPAPALPGLEAVDMANAAANQDFIVPLTQSAAAASPARTTPAETQPVQGESEPTVSLMSELSSNKKELGSSMDFLKDKLFSLTEIANRLEKNPIQDTTNDANAVVAAVNQPKVTTPTAPQAQAPAKSLDLSAPVDSPDWGDHFSQQITWLGQQKIDRAVIKLNPQELGPIEVNIKLHKDDASVTITAHTLHVRDVIEQAIPRLRDMMSEQGINLSQFNIESNTNQRQTDQQGNAPQHGARGASQSKEESHQDGPLLIKSSQGLIDYFA